MSQKSHLDAAIIFARMDSRRLPGKALTKIGERTLIAHCISRLSDSSIFKTIVATSDRSIDDPIVQVAVDEGVSYFRGDSMDLNLRLAGCLSKYNIRSFARINGDSPLISKDLIEQGFDLLKSEDYDFVTNLVPRRFPYGISVEVFQSSFFLDTLSSNQMHENENITSFFYDNLESFKVGNIPYDCESNDHDIRLTVDENEDLTFFEELLKLDPLIFEKPFERARELVRSNKSILVKPNNK